MLTVNQEKFRSVFGEAKLFKRISNGQLLQIYNDKISPPLFADDSDGEFVKLHITEVKPVDTFTLKGTSFLSGNESGDSVITSGTKKHCDRTRQSIEKSGDYWNMTIVNDNEDV